MSPEFAISPWEVFKCSFFFHEAHDAFMKLMQAKLLKKIYI